MAYKSLFESNTFQALQSHAKKPYDLTDPGALTANKRLEKFVCRSSHFDLHFGTQRIDEQVLDLLQNLADELHLVEQFKQMRRGKTINKIEGYESENRQVLHTACRDLFSDNPLSLAASTAAKEELDRLKVFLEELETGKVCNAEGETFESLVHVGIGGSDLGPRAIYEALKPYGQAGRKVHFISNVDPDDAARVLQEVDLKRSLVSIVSKSGTTLETLTNEKLVCAALERQGLDPAKHCIGVTGKSSPLDNPDKYVRSFYMYDYIGGRFSSTSMVGGVMLSFFLGYDNFMRFLEGANLVDIEAEGTDILENIPLLLALLGVWNHNFLGYPSVAILPYSQALHRFPAHLQQCDMESNGKSVHRNGTELSGKTGPIVWGEPGTNGQHAFYQLLHQGTEIVPVEFIGFKESQIGVDLIVEGSSSQQKLFANLLAQMVAMATGKKDDNPNKAFSGNRPSSLMVANKLTPKAMGALLAIYEAKIAFQGFCWDINSFDQEGVQLGKVLANRFLAAMTSEKMDEESLEHTFLKHL